MGREGGCGYSRAFDGKMWIVKEAAVSTSMHESAAASIPENTVKRSRPYKQRRRCSID